jgi:hypothetical protein
MEIFGNAQSVGYNGAVDRPLPRAMLIMAAFGCVKPTSSKDCSIHR